MSKKQLNNRLENLFAAFDQVEDPLRPVTSIPVVDSWQWTLNEHGELTQCDPQITALLGISSTDILGKPFWKLPLTSGDVSPVKNAIQTGIPPLELRVTFLANGVSLPFSVTILSRGADGSLRGVCQKLAKTASPGKSGLDWAAADEIPSPTAPAQTRKSRSSQTQKPSASHPARESAPAPKPIKGLMLDQNGLQPASKIISDAGLTSLHQQLTSATNTKDGSHAALAVPIPLRQQKPGILELIDESGMRTWSEDELLLAQEVANQLALALENAQLYAAAQQELSERIRAEQETLRRNQDLATLNQIGQKLNKIGSPAEILDLVFSMIGQVVDNSNLFIALFDESTQHITFPIFTLDGKPQTVSGKPFGSGVVEQVIRTRAPLLVESNVEQVYSQLSISEEETLPRSILAVPMLAGEKVLGVIVGQDFTKENAFTSVQQELLSTIASQASTALENARLFQQMQAALVAIEVRERYQKNIARAVATLAESGTQSLSTALRMLGEASLTSRVYFAAPEGEGKDLYWKVKAEWCDNGVSAMIDQSEMNHIDPKEYPLWKTHLQELGNHSSTFAAASDTEKEWMTRKGIRSLLLLGVSTKTSLPGFIGFDQIGYDRVWQAEEIEALQMASAALTNTIIREDLLIQLQETLGETETLYNASRRLAVAGSLDEMAAAILETTQSTAVNRSVVLLFNAIGKQLVVAAAHHTGQGTPPPEVGYQYSEEITAGFRPIASISPAFIQDVEFYAGLDEPTRKQLSAENVHSLAVLPLWIGKSCLGALLLETDTLHDFTSLDKRILPPLVGQLAIAIENRRLFEQTQSALNETESLYQASADLNVAHTYMAILESLRKHTLVSGADQELSINLFDHPWSDELEPEGFSVPARITKQTGGKFPDYYFINNFPSARAFRKLNGPFAIPDVATDVRVDDTFRHVYMNIFHARGVIIVPLTVAGEMIGFINAMFANSIEIPESELRRLAILSGQAAVAMQNLRSIETTRKRADEASLLFQTSQKLTRAQTRQELYEIAIAASRQGIPMDGATIFEVTQNNENTYFERVAHFFNSTLSSVEDGERWNANDHAFSSFLVSDETTLSNDLANDPRLNDEQRKALTALKIASLLVVPLKVRGNHAGAIVAIRNQPHAFQTSEVTFLESLSVQLNLSLDNTRLLNEAQRSAEEARIRSEELLRINHMVQKVASSLDLQAGLQTVIDELAESFHLTSGAIALLNQEQTALSIVADYSQNGEHANGVLLPLADNLSSQEVLRSRKPLLIQDAQHNPLTESIHETMRWRGVKTLVILPLIVANEVIGTVGMDFPDDRILSDDEMRLAETMVYQAATAIQNAHLFEQVESALAETELLYKMSRQVSEASTVEELLKLVVDHALPKSTHRASFIFSHRDNDGNITDFEYNCYQERNGSFQNVGGKIPAASLSVLLNMNEPFTYDDATSSSLDHATQDTLLRFNAHSGCIIPLRSSGQLLGFLSASSPNVGHVETQEARILQTAADGISIALEKQRLLQEAERRALELQTAAEIARDTSGTLALDTLLNHIANLLCERFDFYHAGIFLLDETQKYAVIREATGDAGIEMKQRRHRLAVGSKSIIGKVSASGEPLVVNDVTATPDYYPNPLLPETRAEMGIPLKNGDRVIGALDVQSKDVNAFHPSDVAVLTILSDQIAVAIENARAFELSQEAVADMREADRVKSQFLANMSHELRTPLNSIIGFSRVILKGIDGPINEIQEQDLSAIYNSGQHLLALINDILDLSKIEAGKMELSFGDVNIPDLINSVLSTAVGLVKDKPVKLIKNVPSDLPLVRADNTRVRQVLLNLISNAAKFTDEGSITIDVSVEKAPKGGQELVLRVTDTGPGIAEEDQIKLFQPFSQVDDSPTRKTGGTGLGLSICRSLVEMHGGRIGLERSTVGKGSTFAFTLPLPATSTTTEEESDAGPIILAVDDDRQVISLYERYLIPQGYRVVALTESTQAVAVAKELKPFAITLDVMMPNRDGWQVLYDLKNDPDTSGIPVVMCTIMEDKDKGFSLGAADFLSKPILQEELVSAIDRLNQDGRIREVLVVDDDADDLRLVEKILNEQNRYQVTLAQGGVQGWDLITAKPPHAIVLDLFMPDMNGFEVLEKLRADPSLRDIPVIVLSGADLTPEQYQLLAQFGQQLLTKSLLRENDLLSLLDHALKRYQSPQNS
jgi:GAF domain-containing protein/CheY-like chemotaxis protein